MTKDSDAFEQLNGRIHKLLAGSSATVTWNSSIPDPDDPSQMRQIDVLIEQGGCRTSVECRDRAGTQSVMWVEELIGRKQSLRLDGMIGVAVNGFTKLAQKKAAKYGIVLYDFRRLSDAEIASWARAATVEATFVQFQPLRITAGIHQSQQNLLPLDPNAALKFLCQGSDGFGAVMDKVRDDAFANPGVGRTVTLDHSGFEVEGIPLTLLKADYVGQAVPLSAKCTAVEAMAPSGTPVQLREVTVQKFEHTVGEVIRNQNDIHLVVDVSNVSPPPDSILHEMKIKFQTVVTLKGYEVIGNRRMLSKGLMTELIVAITA